MKKLILLLSLFSTLGFGVDKVIKAPTGKVIIGATANVRGSEGAGTTTLTVADAREQIFNLSAARTVKLPTTGIKAGEAWIIKNLSTVTTAILTIQSSGANTLGYNNSSDAKVSCVSLQDTPTSAVHWKCGLDFSAREYLCDHLGTYSYNNSTAISVTYNSTVTAHYYCMLTPYQQLDGTWRLKFQADDNTNGAVTTVSISGILSKAGGGYVQPGIGLDTANAMMFMAIGPSAGAFSTGTNNGSIRLWADIQLNARPTWAY